jgi:hypothetical protein
MHGLVKGQWAEALFLLASGNANFAFLLKSPNSNQMADRACNFYSLLSLSISSIMLSEITILGIFYV